MDVLDGGSDPPIGRGNFWGKGRAETAESIDLPFGLWSRVGRRKHKFNHIRQVVPMCPHEMAHLAPPGEYD